MIMRASSENTKSHSSAAFRAEVIWSSCGASFIHVGVWLDSRVLRHGQRNPVLAYELTVRHTRWARCWRSRGLVEHIKIVDTRDKKRMSNAKKQHDPTQLLRVHLGRLEYNAGVEDATGAPQ